MKTDPGEALSRREGLRPRGAFPASLRELPFKSSQTDLRPKTVVDKGKQTENGRRGKKVSRFDFTRDGRDRSGSSKTKAEEQAVETTREKRENAFSAIKLAGRASRHASEHGFDRNAPKPETNIADNPTFTASNTSSSTKTPGRISHFGEMEMVRRSFEENGLRQLVEKAALNLKNGRQEFRIELKPELLGQVKLQVSTENHQVTIRILTELPVAKELIENNIHQLKADLQGHGLEIDKFEVSLSQGSDKNGVKHDFSESKKMKKGFLQEEASRSASSTLDMEKEDWGRHPRSSNGAINLFA